MRFARFKNVFLAFAAAAFLAVLPAIAQSPSQSPTTGNPAGAGASSKSQGASGNSSNSAGKMVDINSATSDELKALTGIGDVYAQKIIDGRPYANKAQLKSKGIIPAATYDKISGQIIAKQSPKKSK
jgi:DNA uptake protein ComE-like DNA-binding protein